MNIDFESIFLTFFTILGTTALCIHAYIASRVRWVADDYCFSAAAKQGVFTATWKWYQVWECRLAADFFDSLAGKLGPTFPQFLPWLLLGFWVYVCYRLARSFTNYELNKPIAIALPLLTLMITPHIWQSFYWGLNARCVILPLILGTIALTEFINLSEQDSNNQKNFRCIGIFLLIFVAGLFHELYAALQIGVVFTVILLRNWWGKRSRVTNMALFTTATAAVGSFIVLLLSPGMTNRRLKLPPPENFFHLVNKSQQDVFRYFTRCSIHRPVYLLCLLLLPVGLGILSKRKEEKSNEQTFSNKIWILPIGALAVIFVSMMFGRYAIAGMLPERAQIIPTYFLVISFVVCGYLFGRTIKSKYSPLVHHVRFFSYLTMLVLWSTATFLTIATAMKKKTGIDQYQKAWDSNHVTILSAKNTGNEFVEVPLEPNPLGLEDPFIYPRFNWVNQCVNQYYGIQVRYVEEK